MAASRLSRIFFQMDCCHMVAPPIFRHDESLGPSADILPARIRAFQQISTLEDNYPDHRSGTQSYLIDADCLECG